MLTPREKMQQHELAAMERSIRVTGRERTSLRSDGSPWPSCHPALTGGHGSPRVAQEETFDPMTGSNRERPWHESHTPRHRSAAFHRNFGGGA